MDTHNLVLRPNCLLTNAPLVFLSGPRSIFYYEKLGSDLQDYLSAHGYVVIHVPLPFRDRAHRQQSLSHWLQGNSKKPCHFILTSETYKEFAPLLKDHSESTLTIIGNSYEVLSNPRTPIAYRLHKIFCQSLGYSVDEYKHQFNFKMNADYDRFLDHCIQLAEDEVTGA